VLKEDLMVGARFATLSSVVSATVARVASFRTRSWPALTTLVSASPELVFATLSSAASAIVELPASSPMVLLAEEEDLVADLALVLLVAPSCALPSSVAGVIVATPASSAMVMLEDLIFSSFRSGGGGGQPRLCFAFQKGECDRGASCRFSHGDASGAGGFGGVKKGPCFQFQRGECTRGDSCRFSHEISADAN